MSQQINATSYRYEVTRTTGSNGRDLRTASYAPQQQHYQNRREPDPVSDHAIQEREKWNERLDEIWWRKRVSRENNIRRQEMALANKALSMIRHKKMKELYNQEHIQLERELNEYKKTFHKKRI